ncbi:unnamed protein product [Blepharisma stoltei]|uniref:Uncharacterized protein n=1 Tax=Blepharisma stoltei TaxID=1481888 RepID=A0AAU9I688_9CILI|nr:unnamed protein product [Blepharisma stoltei]
MLIFYLISIVLAQVPNQIALLLNITFAVDNTQVSNPLYPPFATWDFGSYSFLKVLTGNEVVQFTATSIFTYPSISASLNNQESVPLISNATQNLSILGSLQPGPNTLEITSSYKSYVYTYQIDIFVKCLDCELLNIKFYANGTSLSYSPSISSSIMDYNCSSTLSQAISDLAVIPTASSNSLISIQHLSIVQFSPNIYNLTSDSNFTVTGFFDNFLENIARIKISSTQDPSLYQYYYFRFNKDVPNNVPLSATAKLTNQEAPLPYYWDLKPRFHPNTYNYTLVPPLASDSDRNTLLLFTAKIPTICAVYPTLGPFQHFYWSTGTYSPGFDLDLKWAYYTCNFFDWTGSTVSNMYSFTFYRMSRNVNLGSLRFFLNPILMVDSADHSSNSSSLELGYSYQYNATNLSSTTAVYDATPDLAQVLTVQSFASTRRYWNLEDINFDPNSPGLMILATGEDSGATVKYSLNGAANETDYFNSPKTVSPLKVGQNNLNFYIVSEDEAYEYIYYVQFNYLSGDTSLLYLNFEGSLDQSPSFSSANDFYSVTIPDSLESFSILCQTTDSNASLYLTSPYNITNYGSLSLMNSTLLLPITEVYGLNFTLKVIAESTNIHREISVTMNRQDACGNGRRWSTVEECDIGVESESNKGCTNCKIDHGYTCSGGGLNSPDVCSSIPQGNNNTSSDPSTGNNSTTGGGNNSTNSTDNNSTNSNNNTSSNQTDPGNPSNNNTNPSNHTIPTDNTNGSNNTNGTDPGSGSNNNNGGNSNNNNNGTSNNNNNGTQNNSSSSGNSTNPGGGQSGGNNTDSGGNQTCNQTKCDNSTIVCTNGTIYNETLNKCIDIPSKNPNRSTSSSSFSFNIGKYTGLLTLFMAGASIIYGSISKIRLEKAIGNFLGGIITLISSYQVMYFAYSFSETKTLSKFLKSLEWSMFRLFETHFKGRQLLDDNIFPSQNPDASNIWFNAGQVMIYFAGIVLLNLLIFGVCIFIPKNISELFKNFFLFKIYIYYAFITYQIIVGYFFMQLTDMEECDSAETVIFFICCLVYTIALPIILVIISKKLQNEGKNSSQIEPLLIGLRFKQQVAPKEESFDDFELSSSDYDSDGQRKQGSPKVESMTVKNDISQNKAERSFILEKKENRPVFFSTPWKKLESISDASVSDFTPQNHEEITFAAIPEPSSVKIAMHYYPILLLQKVLYLFFIVVFPDVWSKTIPCFFTGVIFSALVVLKQPFDSFYYNLLHFIYHLLTAFFFLALGIAEEYKNNGLEYFAITIACLIILCFVVCTIAETTLFTIKMAKSCKRKKKSYTLNLDKLDNCDNTYAPESTTRIISTYRANEEEANSEKPAKRLNTEPLKDCGKEEAKFFSFQEAESFA